MKKVLKIAMIPCCLTLLQQEKVFAGGEKNLISGNSVTEYTSDIKSEIDREYVKADIKNTSNITEPHRLITRTLPVNVFPILPALHRWVKQGDEYVVMKHRFAPEHNLEFAVYADDVLYPSKVNYCTLIDGINVQSFAHTRRETFRGNRDSYSFIVQEPLLPTSTKHFLRNYFKSMLYLDGHCIDHADTISGEKVSCWHSSKDIRNHIPEPNNSYWGKTVRNHFVRSIREEGGCYMQLPYYSINAPETNLGVRVPEGVYFNALSRNVKNDWITISSQNTYQIPWNDDIHLPDQTESWRSLLNKKKVNDLVYGYSPNLSYLENNDLKWWESTIANIQNTSPVFLGETIGYDHMIANNAKIVADWETESIGYKLRYLYHSHLANPSDPELPYWHERTLRHADQLDEFQMSPFDSSQLHEAKYVMRLVDEDQEDHWRQIISDQENFSDGTVQRSIYGRNLRNENRFFQNLTMERDAFYGRKTSTQQVQDNFPVVQFYHGKGSLNLIGREDPETINRAGKIYLKDVDTPRAKKWLEVNEEPFDNFLNKEEIEVYYKPSTTTKKSWKNIEDALEEGGFVNISRKTQ